MVFSLLRLSEANVTCQQRENFIKPHTREKINGLQICDGRKFHHKTIFEARNPANCKCAVSASAVHSFPNVRLSNVILFSIPIMSMSAVLPYEPTPSLNAPS